MIKKIIALIAVLLVAWSYFYMFNLDTKVHKLEKISALIKSTAMEDKKLDTGKSSKPVETKPTQTTATTTQSSKDKEIQEKLKSLKEKAGNIAAFNVSPLYKKNCSSCHGNIGQGIIGPKLMGQSSEKILASLKDFKSGKRKNYVMYGLLGNIDDDKLKELADEISTFQTKLNEATK